MGENQVMASDSWNDIDPVDAGSCLNALQERMTECDEAFRSFGRTRSLARGETLVADEPHCLMSGKCALCLNDPRGESVSLFYFQQGQLVNFLPLLANCFPITPMTRAKKIPRKEFAIRALTDCEFLYFDKDWFVGALLQKQTLDFYVIYSCIINLLNMYRAAHNSPILSNGQRICRFILSVMEDEITPALPDWLTQMEISRHLVMHPITVSKIFGKLRSSGILAREDGKLWVRNMEKLQELANGMDTLNY